MRIASAELQMDAKHSKQQSHEVSSSLRAWIGDRPNAEGNKSASPVAETPTVRISDAAKAAQANEVGASAVSGGLSDIEADPTLNLIRAMIALLTGREVKVFDSSDLQGNTPAPTPDGQPSRSEAPPQQPGFGVEYSRHESYSESEQTRFAASGVVNTADGRQISFSLSLSMTRSYHEESNVSIQFGNARQMQDPLVLNFDGNAAQLTSRRFKFDINADGKSEQINFVAGGSGFVALDRNGDGQINDGSELFGAKSGNGFAELAALDSDNNGWIDENDAAYSQLRVWTKDESGKDTLSTLKQADVGAIALAHTATSFDVRTADNEQQGQIRSSGVFLREDGKAGTVQQIDLTI